MKAFHYSMIITYTRIYIIKSILSDLYVRGVQNPLSFSLLRVLNQMLDLFTALAHLLRLLYSLLRGLRTSTFIL
jgi:hypothetical protein